MSTQKQSVPTWVKVGHYFTLLFHPFGLPFVFYIYYTLVIFNFWFGFLGLFGPVITFVMAYVFYRNGLKKPWFKRLAREEYAQYIRILLPMTLLAALLIKTFFTSFVMGNMWGYDSNMILIGTLLIALFIRWFYNISLHQLSIGLLIGFCLFRVEGMEESLIPMGLLTLAILLGRVQFALKQHRVLESAAGLILGTGMGYLSYYRPDFFYLFSEWSQF